MAAKTVKVVQVLGALEPGGAEVLTLDLCNNCLLLKDIELKVLYRKSGSLNSAFKESGVALQQIKSAKSITALWQFRRLLLAENCDVLHVHQAVDAVRYRIAILFTPIKIVCTHHGYTSGKGVRGLIRWSFKASQLNLFVSQHCFNLYTKFTQVLPNHYQIVLNGIDKKRLTQTFSLKHKLNIPTQNKLFGMTGNFYVDARDQYLVCEALVKILPNLPELHFVFIGGWSAAMEDYVLGCKRLIAAHQLEGRVHFAGSITNAGATLKDLDAFVYMSHYDTFGIALAEAVVMGKHCIINDYPALLEVTKGYNNLTVVESGQIDQLAEAMQTHAIQGERATEELNKTDLSIEKHMSTLTTIYHQL
jgi:glycosyltransferase involved in cell wall biosynthesis